MRADDDQDLWIRRAQSGDAAAFQRLIESHVDQVRRFARSFCHDDETADDLAQEALIKVYRSIGSFRFQSSFSTWIFSITRNVFLDARKSRSGRARAAEQPLGHDLGHAEPENESAQAPDALMEREQDRQRLWAAVEKLPIEFRTTIVLFDIEGLSYDEVAAIEGIALGTVKSRLSRGRDHLRRLLGPPSEESGAVGNPDGMALVPPEGKTS